MSTRTEPKTEARAEAKKPEPKAEGPKVDPRRPTGRRLLAGLEDVGDGRYWVVTCEVDKDGKVVSEQRVGVCPDTMPFQSALLNRAASGLVSEIFKRGWRVA